MAHLGRGERVEADDGYIGEAPRHIKCPKSFTNKQITEFMQQRVRNRQETLNNRLKMWGILSQMFRHNLVLHGSVVRAVLVIVQLAINLGEPLFHCGYKDPPYEANNNQNIRRNTGWQRRNNP